MTLVLVVQVCLAGFLVYPVVMGFYVWTWPNPETLWLKMLAWSLATAALLLVNAAYLWPETPDGSLGLLLSLRHLFLAATAIAVVLVAAELSDGVPRVLLWGTVTFLVVRAVLWFTTDLVWAHGFDAEGAAVYGPLRTPFALLTTFLLTLIGVLALLRRPWKSELARRGLLFAILPGLLLGLLVQMPGQVGEVSVATAFAPSIVALQVIYFADFRRRQRMVSVLAVREGRLASFGTAVLSDPSEVPELAAVNLVHDMLGARCVFTGTGDASRDVVDSGIPPRRRWSPDEQTTDITLPVEVSGVAVGTLCASVPGASDDDRAFVAAVVTVLSAALERRNAEAQIRGSMVTDPLTGLPNWALLLDRVNRLLGRRGALPVGIVCCDVRSMKEINDEFGREAGDHVLQVLAERLERLVGPEGTVARIGADEFVLVEPCHDAPMTEALADRVAAAANGPIDVPSGVAVARMWVGFTVAETADRTADRLVRDAEMAVMLAKRDLAHTTAYSDRVRSQLVGRRRMIRHLHDAIDNGDIGVAYQPIIDLETGEVVAVEALARWTDPDGRAVAPPLFVHLAEESGVIRELGALVFEQAVSDLAAWDAANPAMLGLRLSLNLAPGQLVDPELAPAVAALLDRAGVAPHRITLEVTESGLQQATDATARYLAEFRELGVGLSLDDFGTGYSTLTRLMAFPVTELKIDRQFTLASQGTARLIVPAVVGLAHASGLTVVVEGIETEEQRRLVVGHRCDYGQGYLFARPLPPTEIPGFVTPRRPRASALSLPDMRVGRQGLEP